MAESWSTTEPGTCCVPIRPTRSKIRPGHPDYLAVNNRRRHRLSEALPSRDTDSAVEIPERQSLTKLRPRQEVEAFKRLCSSLIARL